MYRGFASTAEWLRIKPILQARLDFLFDQLAQPGVTFDQTNVLRGQIAEVRHFMKESDPKFIPPTAPASDSRAGY